MMSDSPSKLPGMRSGWAVWAGTALLLGLLLGASGTAIPAQLKAGTAGVASSIATPADAGRDGAPDAAGVQGAMTQAMDEILVHVLPSAEVKGDTFTLGEVAEFDGFDVESSAALAQISLGRSPSPGRPMALSEPLIRSRMAGVAQAERVRLVVPRNAQVVRAAQTLKGADIEARVLAQALKDAGGDTSDLKQELVTPVSDVLAPLGQVDWQVEGMGKHLVPGGDRTYQVTAQVDGREIWRQMLRVRQKVYQTVVVAAHPIRRDQTIAAEDVTTVRRTLNATKEAGYTGSLKSIVGTIAKRPIGQDEPINDGMVRAPAAVTEGSRVTVLYETPQLIMQVPGVAMVPGQLGQFIPVRNLQSGKIVYGIVQADEIVKVN
jgi:flagellar basal body P-ring formation protein FlgA